MARFDFDESDISNRTLKWNLFALWVVVIILVVAALTSAGYLVVSKDSIGLKVSNFEGSSNPVKGLFAGGSFQSVGTDAHTRKSGFTGGFKDSSPAFFDSQSLNDNIYAAGLDADSTMRYFGADPAWAEFENKVVSTLSSVQLLTRYHNTTSGEKIAILVAQANRLGIPVPTSTPPTEASGMMDLSRRSGNTGRIGEEPLASLL